MNDATIAITATERKAAIRSCPAPALFQKQAHALEVDDGMKMIEQIVPEQPEKYFTAAIASRYCLHVAETHARSLSPSGFAGQIHHRQFARCHRKGADFQIVDRGDLQSLHLPVKIPRREVGIFPGDTAITQSGFLHDGHKSTCIDHHSS